MVVEAIVVAVISWIVQRILNHINRDIDRINNNYYKTERSYEIIVNNYTNVINSYNWDALWRSKNIIKKEYSNQWDNYKKMLELQNRLHNSKQDLYDKIKQSHYDKQTKTDSHNVVQELKIREKDIVNIMRNVKSKIDETREKIHSINDEIEEIKRNNRKY